MSLPPGVQLTLPPPPGAEGVLSESALAFVAELTRRFRPTLQTLLDRRGHRQSFLDALARGEKPASDEPWARPLDFLAETASVRAGEWQIAPVPAELHDRRVEITGPIDRKMIINALNSGANVFMADCEDSNAPTWDNVVRGQQNLADAVRGTIRLEQGGKSYALGAKPAVLFVRPRGLHLPEAHLLVDGRPAPGSLVDFGLYLFHNAKERLARGSGTYLYLPKLESHLEARLWNDVFVEAERRLDLPIGTIKATVLIETLPAAFEMDEILYELRDHSAGLNCGRWDYIFSFVKRRRAEAAALLPDRSVVTMDRGFLRAYVLRLIETCHRRGAHAMGGMAAQIPIKDDPQRNEAALAKVRADKQREVNDGHDGTWVAHPGLVPIAKEIFDAGMKGKDQLHVRKAELPSRAELLAVPEGPRTEAGLRHGCRVAIRYLAAWLDGNGCVPLYDLMEDAATAEICRVQIWQWRAHGAAVDGTPLTDARLTRILDEELAGIRRELGDAAFDGSRATEARALFGELCASKELAEFLTLPAYERVVARGA